LHCFSFPTVSLIPKLERNAVEIERANCASIWLASAAFEASYESASQFNREYSLSFGQTPL